MLGSCILFVLIDLFLLVVGCLSFLLFVILICFVLWGLLDDFRFVDLCILCFSWNLLLFYCLLLRCVCFIGWLFGFYVDYFGVDCFDCCFA